MIIYLITSQYYNHNKDLKVKHILYILKNPIRLHEVAMMIKYYKFVIELEHIHVGQMLLKYVTVRC